MYKEVTYSSKWSQQRKQDILLTCKPRISLFCSVVIMAQWVK